MASVCGPDRQQTVQVRGLISRSNFICRFERGDQKLSAISEPTGPIVIFGRLRAATQDNLLPQRLVRQFSTTARIGQVI
jgi:hypothetical protein